MNNIITIVTPSYNQGQYLGDTIKSVVTQAGNFYIDYIIQDGASTDKSIDIIKSWEHNLKSESDILEYGNHVWMTPKSKGNLIQCNGISFRWDSHRDSGQSEAINNGFKLGFGELAGWVNSDDTLMPGTLNRAFELYRFFRGVIFGKAQAVDGDGKQKWIQDFWKRRFTLYDSLILGYTPPQPSVFFPLELYRKVGGLNESLHYMLDTDLWQRMIKLNGPFNYVSELWSRQIYHENSKSMQGDHLFSAFADERIYLIRRRKKEIGFMIFVYETRFFFRKCFILCIEELKKIVKSFLHKR